MSALIYKGPAGWMVLYHYWLCVCIDSCMGYYLTHENMKYWPFYNTKNIASEKKECVNFSVSLRCSPPPTHLSVNHCAKCLPLQTCTVNTIQWRAGGKHVSAFSTYYASYTYGRRALSNTCSIRQVVGVHLYCKRGQIVLGFMSAWIKYQKYQHPTLDGPLTPCPNLCVC